MKHQTVVREGQVADQSNRRFCSLQVNSRYENSVLSLLFFTLTKVNLFKIKWFSEWVIHQSQLYVARKRYRQTKRFGKFGKYEHR